MKIWKLHILWEKENESILLLEKRLSRLDIERIQKYLKGGFHVHANPGKRRAEHKETERIVQEVSDRMAKEAEGE